MKAAGRLESKYLLDAFAYHRVRNAIQPYFKYDSFSQASPDRRYLVRSLYYDNDDYRAYFEKVSGVNDRNKLRIRSYFARRDDAPFLNIEQKRRQGRCISKLATKATMAQYDQFIATGSWGDTKNTILLDFERIVRKDQLKPVAIVQYAREAYFARDGGGARVSFDHDVKYAQSTDLFKPNLAYRDDIGKHVVFEIKVQTDDLGWLSRLVQALDLNAVPNSKYANAIDHTPQPIWYSRLE